MKYQFLASYFVCLQVERLVQQDYIDLPVISYHCVTLSAVTGVHFWLVQSQSMFHVAVVQQTIVPFAFVLQFEYHVYRSPSSLHKLNTIVHLPIHVMHDGMQTLLAEVRHGAHNR